jgi:hypothetical protein
MISIFPQIVQQDANIEDSDLHLFFNAKPRSSILTICPKLGVFAMIDAREIYACDIPVFCLLSTTLFSYEDGIMS